MSPLKKLTFASLLLLSSSLQPALAAHNDPKDVSAIREVVEVFRTSIIKKDKATFVGLFYSDNGRRGQVNFQVRRSDISDLKTLFSG